MSTCKKIIPNRDVRDEDVCTWKAHQTIFIMGSGLARCLPFLSFLGEGSPFPLEGFVYG